MTYLSKVLRATFRATEAAFQQNVFNAMPGAVVELIQAEDTPTTPGEFLSRSINCKGPRVLSLSHVYMWQPGFQTPLVWRSAAACVRQKIAGCSFSTMRLTCQRGNVPVMLFHIALWLRMVKLSLKINFPITLCNHFFTFFFF